MGAAKITPTDTILEIGPGLGILTQALARVAKRVVAVEKDLNMAGILKKSLGGVKNVELVQGDILEINFKFQMSNVKSNPKSKNPTYQILDTKYKVVANLPYYITSPFIRKFLEAKQKPELLVLMVQKEVAQRICAKPPHMSLLAVSVQFYGKPEIVSYVKKFSFWPQPKVDSTILKITPLNTEAGNQQIFFKIARAGFKQPRKQLAGNLAGGLKMPHKKVEEWLLKNGILPTQRAETLQLQDWKTLAETFQKI